MEPSYLTDDVKCLLHRSVQQVGRSPSYWILPCVWCVQRKSTCSSLHTSFSCCGVWDTRLRCVLGDCRVGRHQQLLEQLSTELLCLFLNPEVLSKHQHRSSECLWFSSPWQGKEIYQVTSSSYILCMSRTMDLLLQNTSDDPENTEACGTKSTNNLQMWGSNNCLW